MRIEPEGPVLVDWYWKLTYLSPFSKSNQENETYILGCSPSGIDIGWLRY